MNINIKNSAYFQRGTMSLTPAQKRALDANAVLTVVDKKTKRTHTVDNNIARTFLAQRFSDDNKV